jgi:hypothetical protein
MLDIDTTKGQQSKVWEQRCMDIVCAHTDLQWSKTVEPCSVDGILTDRRRQVRYVVEQKSRQMTQRHLITAFSNEWLMTAGKLQHLQTAARVLNAAAVGVLYLVPDDTVLVIRLANADGQLVATIRYAETETQATINGGRIVRANAFIAMQQAVRYHAMPVVTAQDLQW